MKIVYTNLTRTAITGRLIVFLALALSSVSCEEFVRVELPRNEISSDLVFGSDETAMAAIRGIYSTIMASNSSGFAGGASGVSLLTGLSSDEMMAVSLQSDFYASSLAPTNTTIRNALWEPAYKYIYFCNSIMEGLGRSGGLSTEIRRQLEGEARFIRAFCYFYLVNMFGDVPLVLVTDYNVTSKVTRSSAADVYAQINADLQDSANLLADDYSFSNGHRIRPNRLSATALLARSYLFTGDWAGAELMASQLIDHPLYRLEADLNKVFLANSTEAVLQFMPVVPGYNTWDGNRFIPVFLSSAPQYSLNPALMGAFESGDKRMSKWVGSFTAGGNTYHYPFKYKVNASATVTEYLMVLRLAEQYLIRAEARARQGNLSGAVADLDVIRQRAGLPLIQDTEPAIAQEELLAVILRERQTEFFTEWGHRWFDLKRTARVDEVMASVKGTSWQSTDALYPIPQTEMDRNSNLIQNAGY